MKLTEIIPIPVQTQHNIADMSIFDDAKRFRHVSVEGYPLFYNETVNAYYFYISDNNQKISFLIALKNVFNNKNCLIVQRTWTIRLYRNRGFMKALYNTLYNQGFVIISDSQISPESISVWKALGTILPVKIIDTQTEEIRDIDIGDYTVTNHNVRFILEKCISRFDQDLSNILLEYELFVDNKYKELQQ